MTALDDDCDADYSVEINGEYAGVALFVHERLYNWVKSSDDCIQFYCDDWSDVVGMMSNRTQLNALYEAGRAIV